MKAEHRKELQTNLLAERMDLQDGMAGLYPSRNLSSKSQTEFRSLAARNVEKARDLYLVLGDEVRPFAARGTNNALLLQESLLGAARAEEALTDVPQGKEG